jgi:hypothetical protein
MSSSSCRRPADAPLSRRCGLERSFDPMGRPTIWPSADPGSSSAFAFQIRTDLHGSRLRAQVPLAHIGECKPTLTLIHLLNHTVDTDTGLSATRKSMPPGLS